MYGFVTGSPIFDGSHVSKIYWSIVMTQYFWLETARTRLRSKVLSLRWEDFQLWNKNLTNRVKCEFWVELGIISTYYRVSRKTVHTFVSLISRLPRGLDIPSWAFFNCPIRVEFKTIHFFIIRWNLDRGMAKLLWGSHSKLTFFVN